MPQPVAHQLIVYKDSDIILFDEALAIQNLLNVVLGDGYTVDIEEI